MTSDGRSEKHGRPQKFGRPAQLVALTLPNDVLQWLHSIHPDAGWALVSLHERLAPGKAPKTYAKKPEAELVQLTARQALIVVNAATLRGVRGVTILPMARGRAFMALENGHSIADLELAILDRLGDEAVSGSQRAALIQVREQVKKWRTSRSWRIKSRSIILVEPRRVKYTAAPKDRA
jgi:hypothetical protein